MYTPARKTFVDVECFFGKDGKIIPRSILWEDGRRYEIDRITETVQGPLVTEGPDGFRFTIWIGRRRSYLYFEKRGTTVQHYGRWFVERKDAGRIAE